MNVTEALSPNVTTANQNVIVYGHINFSDGEDVSDAEISIYLNGTNILNNSIFVSSNKYGSGWWNISWIYRTKVETELTVSSGSNNTIVLINFSTISHISEGKMNSDCGDVRFTDTNGTELSYTLETSTCNTSNTIFWVWTNLTGNANTTIYAYYGNSDTNLKTDYTNPDDSLVLYMHFDNSSEYGENDTHVFDFSKYGNIVIHD